MILFINTSLPENIILELKDEKGKKIKVKKIKADRQQAEKLLPGIEKLLLSANKKLKDLKMIEVAAQGGSFTSLRIGVVTANALAYALNIPVVAKDTNEKIIKDDKDRKFKNHDIISPRYDREPNIGVKKVK